jgi:hypothetical protein
MNARKWFLSVVWTSQRQFCERKESAGKTLRKKTSGRRGKEFFRMGMNDLYCNLQPKESRGGKKVLDFSILMSIMEQIVLVCCVFLVFAVRL